MSDRVKGRAGGIETVHWTAPADTNPGGFQDRSLKRSVTLPGHGNGTFVRNRTDSAWEAGQPAAETRLAFSQMYVRTYEIPRLEYQPLTPAVRSLY